MKHHYYSMKDIVEKKIVTPLPISVFPNYMGININSVHSVAWTEQEDGQLVDLHINFLPADETR